MKSYKYVFALLLSLSCLTGLLGQTNKKTLNYQAVILDPKAIDIPGASIVGQPLNKGNVCLRFSLLNAQGGLDYEETQQVTTDEYGLVNVAIGAGAQAQAGNSTSIYKSFESVLWNSSVKSLKVSVSYDGCNSFKQVSAQALNYTPYALYAEAVDYKNVREAPTKLSQFSNDAGFLIPKDLDPLKSDIQTNSSKIEVANKTITDNKQASDAKFLVVNQSISSLDTQVAANTTAIKENTSSISNINTKITDQQNQISDNRNQITATNNNLNTQIGGLQGQLNTTNSTVNSLSGVAELVSNKSTAINLGGANPSDQAYPSQKAAKAYIDNSIYDAVGSGVPDATTLAAGKVKLAGDLGGTAANPTVPALINKENTANKSLNVLADGTDNTKYPSVKAVKDYVDQATLGTALAADLANKANIASPAFTGTPTAPTPTLGDNSTKLATTAYVDAQVSAGAADATTTSKGIVRLIGDLGGTATSPTVPGLLLKEDVLNKSNAALGTSTTLYPTQNAVKTYVDAQVASATIADADATTKGKLQLTGDLGGTASSPTVPGLTAKANIASPTFTGTVTSPIYASAPQNLTDAATISWNPANGLNANVTLGGNRTLSFSSTPASGSYGTLVVTQDATGGRTLTLPSGTNKVLGSASTTTIALSSAANAKDILNFYYDGLTSTYYWNVGQGYGIAETIESTNLASAVTGTLPVANGGTGAISATAALTALGAQASANLSTNITTDAASTTKYPAVKTIKDYVDVQVSSATIADADATTRGKIQLAGDLAGSATSPSVVKINGVSLAGLPTGILKNTTTSGIPSIAVAGTDYLAAVSPGATGNVLTSNGTTWSSSAPQNSANTISGVVPVANGGTGLSSVTNGGAVYASSSSALTTGTLPLTAGGTGVTSQQAAINILTGTQTSGRYLRSDGTDARLSTIQAADVPTLNQNTTGTAANVSGTVAVANGGTGLTTLTANNVLLGNGSSAIQAVAPGTSGNVLTSDGTTWTSTAPTSAGVPYTGASQAVNLGAYDLTVNGLTVGKGKKDAGTAYQYNTALGVSALNSFTGGTKNTALGYNALSLVTNSEQNIAIGVLAMGSTTADFQQTVAVGNQALNYNRGSFNTALGSNALSSSNLTSTATYLVGVGALALNNNSSGQNNTAVGSYALSANTTGNNNTGLGQGADVTSGTLSNATAIGYNARVSTSNTIQLGNTSVANVQTSGTLTAGDVTYPKTHGTANQVLSTTGSGTLTWATPSTTATAYSGTLPIANGGTNSTATATSGGIGYGTGTAHAYSSAGTSGQVLISAGAGTPTWATLTAGTAITITNTAGTITIAAAVRPMTEQTTATSTHAVATATFTLSNTPLNSKVWMFINGVRTNNNAYTVSGTTVTYTAANNNSYTIVAGDRIQFDYAY